MAEKNTIRHIIYSIRERLNIYMDDSKVSDEYIAYEINDGRNLLLRQYLSNLKKPIPLQALSVICVPFEQDPECLGNVVGVTLKSKLPIPATLEATGRSNIHKIHVDNKYAKNLNIIDFERLPYLASNEFNHNQIYFCIDEDGYALIYSKNSSIIFLDKLKLSIVAENPEEAWELNCNNENCNPLQEGESRLKRECVDCDYMNSKYPIPGELLYPLRDLVTQTILTKYKIPIDNDNNGMDDTLPNNLILDYARRKNRSMPNINQETNQ